MQTIQSYQEFPIRAPSLQPTRAARLLKLVTQRVRVKLVISLTPLKFLQQRTERLKFVLRAKLVKHLRQVNEWMPVAMVAAAVVILTGCVFPPPYFSRSSAFTIQERDGQLRIALRPRALSPGTRLQIVDGEERRSIAIPPSLTSVLYVPRSRDVHITLVR